MYFNYMKFRDLNKIKYWKYYYSLIKNALINNDFSIISKEEIHNFLYKDIFAINVTNKVYQTY